MQGPLIFIATNRLKPGQLDSERARVPGLVEFVEANEPRLIAFNEYLNETGDEVSVVQVHPDAASMEAHIAIVAERARAAYAETLDATVRIQVFGQPSEEMLTALKQQAGEGVEIALHTEHLGASLARSRPPPSAKPVVPPDGNRAVLVLRAAMPAGWRCGPEFNVSNCTIRPKTRLVGIEPTPVARRSIRWYSDAYAPASGHRRYRRRPGRTGDERRFATARPGARRARTRTGGRTLAN